MKKQIMILFAMVFSIGLSAQNIDNVTSCDFEVKMHIQSITSACGPSLGTLNVSVNPGINALPSLPPGYEYFAAEVMDPSGMFILGVASACSLCGITTSTGAYPCTISGIATADWSICGTLKLTN